MVIFGACLLLIRDVTNLPSNRSREEPVRPVSVWELCSCVASQWQLKEKKVRRLKCEIVKVPPKETIKRFLKPYSDLRSIPILWVLAGLFGRSRTSRTHLFAQTLRRIFSRVSVFTFEWCLAGGDKMSLSWKENVWNCCICRWLLTLPRPLCNLIRSVKGTESRREATRKNL